MKEPNGNFSHIIQCLWEEWKLQSYRVYGKHQEHQVEKSVYDTGSIGKTGNPMEKSVILYRVYRNHREPNGKVNYIIQGLWESLGTRWKGHFYREMSKCCRSFFLLQSSWILLCFDFPRLPSLVPFCFPGGGPLRFVLPSLLLDRRGWSSTKIKKINNS